MVVHLVTLRFVPKCGSLGVGKNVTDDGGQRWTDLASAYPSTRWLILSDTRALLGPDGNSRFFTSSVIIERLSREALVRGDSTVMARKWSGTDILEEQWSASNSAVWPDERWDGFVT